VHRTTQVNHFTLLKYSSRT